MISRTIHIKKNGITSTIKEFAKLMEIQHCFLCSEREGDKIDFSFYERREPWLCYSKYDNVKNGFDFFIDINIYKDYNKFWLLLVRASKNGFDICLPDEFAISPYVYQLIKNGHVAQVLEDDLDNNKTFKIIKDGTLDNELILEQNLDSKSYIISIFLYWAYKKGLLIESISRILDKLEEPKNLESFNFLLKNSIMKPVLYDYYFVNDNEFPRYYLYDTKLFFYDMATKVVGENVFQDYVNDLEERKIPGKDFIEIWLRYHKIIDFDSGVCSSEELFDIFDFRYDEYILATTGDSTAS